MFQTSAKSSWSNHSQSAKTKSGDALLKLVDLGLAATVFLVPLILGGRHPWGRLIFVTVIGATAVTWCLRQWQKRSPSMPRSGVEWLIAAGAVLLAVQLIPLPLSWLNFLSPSLSETLPLWNGQGDAILGPWNRLSLTPILTQGALVTFLAYSLVFLVAYQRIETPGDVRRIVKWIALAATAMAVFGLVQFFLSNGKFFWLFRHPTRHTYDSVKGPFVNENHFGHFLALGIGPMIWWILSEIKSSKRNNLHSQQPHASSAAWSSPKLIGLSIGLVCIGLAGVLTLSRGALIVLIVATIASLVGFSTLSLVGRRTVVALGAIGLLMLVALGLHGSDRLPRVWSEITSGSIEQLDHEAARRTIWQANLDTTAAFPWLGTGAGSHRDVYPLFFTGGDGPEFVFAESGFLQVLSETGGVGFALLFIGLAVVSRWCFVAYRRSESKRDKALAVACMAGLLISTLHAVFDFAWYIPGCMVLTLLLTACVARLCRWSKGKEPSEEPAFTCHRWGWAVAGVTIASITFAMIKDRVGPALQSGYWDQYLAMSLATNAHVRPNHRGSLAFALGEVDSRSPEVVDEMIRWLEQAVRRDPHNCRTQLRLSSLYLHRFEISQQSSSNAMGLSAIRDAAMASQFTSKQSLDDWLVVAIGENRFYLDRALYHTMQSLELCPLQGQAYLQMAELTFLVGEGEEEKSRYVEQALLVRPNDGAVLFSAGREAALAGNTEKTMQLWKQSFHVGRQHQVRIVELLADALPADAFLESFEPDIQGARILYAHYRQSESQEPMTVSGRYLVDLLVAEIEDVDALHASEMWYEIHVICDRMGQTNAALDAAERAVLLRPSYLPLRRAFAYFLCREGRHGQAVDHIKWCLRRKPHDEQLLALLGEAMQQQIRSDSSRQMAEQDAGTEVR